MFIWGNPSREAQGLCPVGQTSYHFRLHNTQHYKGSASYLFHLSVITRLSANGTNTNCLHPHPVIRSAFCWPFSHHRRDSETAVVDTWGGVCCNVLVHSCVSLFSVCSAIICIYLYVVIMEFILWFI